MAMRGDRLDSCPDIKEAGRNVEDDCQVVNSGIQEDTGQVLRYQRDERTGEQGYKKKAHSNTNNIVDR